MERNPEQTEFYNSVAWKETRAAFMEIKHHICERCGRAAKVVHHKVYVDAENVGDPMVTLSFDNLECLCQDCHNAEHFRAPALRAGLRFDDDGSIVSR